MPAGVMQTRRIGGTKAHRFGNRLDDLGKRLWRGVIVEVDGSANYVGEFAAAPHLTALH